jgi:hypothetical protein
MSVCSQEEQLAIEHLIDKHGLGSVLETIAVLCGDKAGHIRASYSDNALASAWDKAERTVFRCSFSHSVLTVTP